MLLAPLVRGRKGAARGSVRRDPQGGLRAGAGRRRVLELEHVAGARSAEEPHDRGRRRSIDRPRRRPHPPGRVAATGLRQARPRHASCLVPTEADARGHGGSRNRDALDRALLQHALRLSRLQASASRSSSRARSASTAPTALVPACEGLGVARGVRPGPRGARLPACRLRRGAIVAWKRRSVGQRPSEPRSRSKKLLQTCRSSRPETPLDGLQAAATAKNSSAATARNSRPADAARTGIRHRRRTTRRQEQLEAFRGAVTCLACGGARLRPEALGVRIAGQGHLTKLTRLSRRRRHAVLRPLYPLPSRDQPIAEPIVARDSPPARDSSRRSASTTSRSIAPADTLTGGELQRVRLATGIGSGLVGVCYVLDEPSIGLHPRDNQRLIDALRDLQQQGNTVLVVEHDEAMMRQADWLIDMGPGAGMRGGQIVAQGHARRSRGRSRTRSPAIICPARTQIELPAQAPQGRQDAGDLDRRRDDQQPEERRPLRFRCGAVHRASPA